MHCAAHMIDRLSQARVFQLQLFLRLGVARKRVRVGAFTERGEVDAVARRPRLEHVEAAEIVRWGCGGGGVAPDDSGVAESAAGDGDDVEALAALAGGPSFFEAAATTAAFGPAAGKEGAARGGFGVGVGVGVEWEAGEGEGGGEGGADARDEGVEGGVEFGEGFFGGRRFWGAWGVVRGKKREWACGWFRRRGEVVGAW